MMPSISTTGVRAGFVSACLLAVLGLSDQVTLHAAAPRTRPDPATARPRTNRELRELKHPKPKAPEPIVIDGVMRSAMGYPRVFARIFFNGQPVMGRPAQDVLQRARALNGDFMDLNLAASSGPQSWWTAVLDTGAGGHSVNQDTVARFGLRNAGDVITTVTGIDGEDVKGTTWIYVLNLSGSDGHLSEEPSMPFVPVEPAARFNLELRPYQPQRSASPDGANLIGMPAIRRVVVEIDTGNATTAMLGESIDMSSSRAFEESLRSITSGPRVRLRPPAFRPTNDVVRIPLRYVDATRLRAGAGPVPPLPSIPFVMGVRGSHLGKQVIGNFLFDTGSSATMISRRLASQLGLLPNSGPVYDKPEFQNPLVGINNREIDASGFVIDSLELLSPGGQIVQWRNVPVLVHDVAIRQADGSFVIQDGILGNNLFLPSTDGELTEKGLKVKAAPFARYWINGPLGEVWLQRPPPNPNG